MTLPFIKMNGAGNDFVIFDARAKPLALSPEQIRKIADRRNEATKGCDQLIVLEHSPKADVFMRIYNADGGEVDACGNATRCIASLLTAEKGADKVSIETAAGLLEGGRGAGSEAWANMGAPRLEWEQIPLAHPVDTLHLPIGEGLLSNAVAVSMGNPHAVFFVPDAQAIDLTTVGPKLEHDPWFPERANISMAQVNSDSDITLRVWERGAGETQACGTAACAVAVAANRRGLTGRKVTIHAKGGDLGVEWLTSGDVLFKGPIELSFKGTLDVQ